MVNTAVDSVIPQTLHDANDRLPVDADFQFMVSGVEEEKEWRRKEMDLVDRREVIGTP